MELRDKLKAEEVREARIIPPLSKGVVTRFKLLDQTRTGVNPGRRQHASWSGLVVCDLYRVAFAISNNRFWRAILAASCRPVTSIWLTCGVFRRKRRMSSFD